MSSLPELYFKNDIEWRNWLHDNHQECNGVYLIFYKVESEMPSMRWEEAVRERGQISRRFWVDFLFFSVGTGLRNSHENWGMGRSLLA